MDYCSPKIILYLKQEWQLLKRVCFGYAPTYPTKNTLLSASMFDLINRPASNHPHQTFNAFTYGLIANYGLTKFADLVRDFHFWKLNPNNITGTG